MLPVPRMALWAEEEERASEQVQEGIEAMKEWPRDPKETVPIEDLLTPVAWAMRFLYRLQRKNTKKDVPYSGFITGPATLVCCPTPREMLTVDGLQHAREQGRTPLDEVLTIAFQLGFEQGVRWQRGRFTREG